MRALIVEDEIRLARNLKRALETLPTFAADVLDYKERAINGQQDAVVLKKFQDRYREESALSRSEEQ